MTQMNTLVVLLSGVEMHLKKGLACLEWMDAEGE